MTVAFGPGIIRVNHDLLGKGELAFQLGQMSTEFAIWLKAKIEYVRAGHDETDIKLSSTKLRNWDYRCRRAATRGYAQPYSDDRGALTELGQTMANYAKQKIALHHDHLEEIHALEPDAWTTADDALIIASFTIRQASMLKLLYNAILDAERTNRTSLDDSFHNPRKDAIPAHALYEGQVRKEARQHQQITLLDTFEQMQKTELSQEFQAIMIDLDADATAQSRQAWVPTFIFGHKARNDLKTLIRFGMVDVKQMFGTGRGRPRHVVRVSPPGIVVVNHLIRKNMI